MAPIKTKLSNENNYFNTIPQIAKPTSVNGLWLTKGNFKKKLS